jgi:hypothetical protein
LNHQIRTINSHGGLNNIYKNKNKKIKKKKKKKERKKKKRKEKRDVPLL